MAMPIVATAQWRKMKNDDSILIAAAQRDPAEFAALYDRYVQPVYRYFYSRLASPADAEDLTAQTFLAALESLPRYHHRGHLSAWLFAIARNKAMDHFRRRRPQVPLSEADRSDEPDPVTRVARGDEIKRLLDLVRGLGESDRELIRLRFAAGLSFAEMAALLKKKEDTVKKSLYRLLARLQSQLEESHA
ncbi:MAG: RNA polymerase sigma-70 factor ECF subfamily [Anaerolineaceae bacterium]|nr:MAG: RNA polymerase sigma-70 factor ECF subfamily [Anaerolineaceae bacterium]